MLGRDSKTGRRVGTLYSEKREDKVYDGIDCCQMEAGSALTKKGAS